MRFIKFLKNLVLYFFGKIKPYKIPYYKDHLAVIAKSMEKTSINEAKEQYLSQFSENPVKVRNGQTITLCIESNDYGEKNKEKIQKMREIVANRTGPKPDLLAAINKYKY